MKESNPAKSARSAASTEGKLGQAGKVSKGLSRPSVGKSLAFDALHRFDGTAGIVDVQLGAVVVPERELVQISLKLLFSAVLVNIDHAALEHAEKTFDRVRGHITSGVFFWL